MGHPQYKQLSFACVWVMGEWVIHNTSNYHLPILLTKHFDNRINLLQIWMNDFHVSTYLPTYGRTTYIPYLLAYGTYPLT
jgi:hypothetical protein